MHISKFVRILGSFIQRTCRSLSLQLLLIQVVPCSYGSIIKGLHLLLVTMIPFDIETESIGKPSILQSWIYTGSPIVPSRVHFSLTGIYNSVSFWSQLSTSWFQ